MSLFRRFNRPKTRRVTLFDGQDYRKAMMAAAAWLEQHRDTINKLNVFPVPDGDTGTNMAATMRSAIKEIADTVDTNVSVVAHKLSDGAIRGARGNSGVILSQILRGIAHGLDKKPTFTAEEFSAALQNAAQTAYRAVIKPVEGTILTVIRESAEAAKSAADHGSDLTALMQEVVNKARQTVARTPDLLPTLKQAGVVDAGGQGLTTIFEGFLRYTQGENVAAPPPKPTVELDLSEVHRGDVSVDEMYGYEVVFLLRGENLDLEKLRDTIVEMGGVSTVVAGDETMLKVHTHTLTPGKILDYGVSLGSLEDINIENLQAQSLQYAAASARERGVADRSTATTGAIPQADAARSSTRTISQPRPPVGDVATVAVVSGPGFERVFESLNVNAIVHGGQTMNPSTQELLDAVNSVPASKVILLPNNGNIIMSAQQVKDLTQKDVRVIPTRSMCQGIASLIAYNFEADFDANVSAMQAATQNVHTGEITRAVRDAQVDGVSVREGDTIGLVNDVMIAAGQDLKQVLHDTLEKMDVANREIVTLYFGAGVTMEDAQRTAQQITEWYPDQEIEVVDGGQPHYTYIISAE
jgi:uncharacterized protein